MNFGKLFAKAGWLLVVIGFFQPIACNMNGLQIANYMQGAETTEATWGAICLYAVLGIAVIGLGCVLLLLIKGDPINDFVFLVPDVIFGLIVFFKYLGEYELQQGGIMIGIGWAIVLVGSIIAVFVHKKRKPD